MALTDAEAVWQSKGRVSPAFFVSSFRPPEEDLVLAQLASKKIPRKVLTFSESDVILRAGTSGDVRYVYDS